MKQTNNALKYLLAQYRAIFKHAYVKGLASAMLVTAALAAGQAQAATPDSEDNYYQYISGSWRETPKVPGNGENNSVIVTGALAGDAINVSGDGSADEAKKSNVASGGNIYLGSGTGLPSGAAASLASGAAAGGWAQATDTATATGNKLTVQGNGKALNGGNEKGRGILYGARANSTAGIAIAEGNQLIIKKGDSASDIAFDNAAIGGQAKGKLGAQANNNLVDIDGSEELDQKIVSGGGSIIGGQAADAGASATGDFIASGNTVDINQAAYTAESSKTLNIFGGQATLTNDSDANSLRAIGNSVILNHVNFDNASGKALNIFGNYAEVGSTGSADTVRADGIAGKLSVDIKNSTLNKAVVLGGRAVNSGSASASNLSVSITDTKFLGTSSLVGAASVDSNYSGETVSSFANNNSLILSNSKPTTNTYSFSDGQIVGASVALKSGSPADVTGSALSASNNTVEITGYPLIDTAINGALITQGQVSGATVTMDSNSVVFAGTLGTDNGTSSIRAAYGAGGLGRLTNNTLEIKGTVNNAEIVAAQLNSGGYSLPSSEQHVLTGNAITIGSDAVITGGSIRAVFGDLATSIATNNDVTISGQVKNVGVITGGAGADSVIDLQSSSRYDLTNTTGTIGDCH